MNHLLVCVLTNSLYLVFDGVNSRHLEDTHIKLLFCEFYLHVEL